MRFGSVCSGIEAASVAWHPLGWQAAWLSEIEPFPCAVLAHHYPDVPNLGDMTALPHRIASGEVEAPDLFCGGTPCQAFSVAGLRKSLDDARGNLSMTFCEIANAIDTARAGASQPPAIIFWENVPGVLSTKDNAFGCFIAGLAGETDPVEPPRGKWPNAGVVLGPQRTVAWRILDAQYFGVAQRRRRVFVVASARDGFDPATVLFEFDGVRRDSAPSREAGKAAAGCAGTGAAVSSGHGYWLDAEDRAATLRAQDSITKADTIITMAHGQGGAEIGYDRGPTLTCNHEAPIAAYTTKLHNTQSNQAGKVYEEYATSLDANSPPPAVFQPVAFQQTADCLTAVYGTKWNGNASATNGGLFAAQPMVLMDQGGSVMNVEHDMVGTLRRETHGHEPAVLHAMQVRRLTPVECERLQGFPDNYTAIPWRKKPASECPDGPRYKALGNSWAVPVVRWIGKRIQEALT